MPIFIKYQYQIAGENDIKRSMSSVAEHAARENARVVKTQARGRQSPVGVAAANSNASIKEAERAAIAKEKADIKAANASIKAHDKAEREKTRITEKEARARSEAEISLQRQRSTSLMAMQKQHLADVAKAARVEEATTARQRANFYATTRGVVGGTARRVASIASGAMAVAGIGGTALAANALHSGMVAEKSAFGLANQMAKEGETPEDIRKRAGGLVKQASGMRGFSTADALGSARAFGGISGNYQMGMDMGNDLSQIALATDVGLEDVSKLAGNAYMKLKTPDMSEAEAKKQTLEAVRMFAGQGNVGAVEIKDLAQYGGRLTAGANAFQGTRLQNMGRMGTLAQVAVGSGMATDAAEATTSAEHFAADLSKHQDEVSKLKIDGKNVSAFTDKSKTKLRGIKELVGDVVEGTGGSIPAMNAIFGERSKKMTDAFRTKFVEAETANAALAPGARMAKGKAGRAAIEAEFDKFDKAALSEKDQGLRAEAALTSTTAQLDQAMKDMNTALSRELLPMMPGLIRSFADLAKPLADIVGKAAAVAGWLASNPFAGMAALLSGAFLLEVAKAKIADTIKNAMLSGGTGGGAAATATGVLGALAIGAATFSVASAILNIAEMSNQKAGERAGNSLNSQWTDYNTKAEEIRKGDGTAQDKAQRLEDLASTARKNVALTKESVSSSMPDWASKGIGAAAAGGNPLATVFQLIQHAVGSETARGASKGADKFDAQLAKDQMEAAKMLQTAAKMLSSGGGQPSAAASMPNRGNSPSPVK